jgi:hypothetical protein
MSRLESMRRRLTAQIDGLNWAIAQAADIEGDFLDLGLGNGRTYDHLREYAPERRIWVIDRVLKPHPSCIPPERDFLQGEAEDMLIQLAANGHKIALAHYDFGYGVKEDDVAEGAKLSPFIQSVMAKGGLVVSQQPLIGFDVLPQPAGIAEGRYHFYRNP